MMAYKMTSLVAQTVKRLPTMRETRVQSLGLEDLLEKEMATHSSILPGKSYGQRSLVGIASQLALVVKNLPASAGDTRDMGSIPELGRSPGGGHGNSPQYPCLEIPMDRGAWQTTVHWVTQSHTESDRTEAT